MADAEAHSRAGTLEILSHGHIALQSTIPWSSNYTFLVTVTLGANEMAAVYKPREGERPLSDFDPGTLCQREVAAFVLSEALGWPDIPPTVLREGPYGVGSVQQFVQHDRRAHYFTLRERAEHVEALQRMAAFDYVANNADRKGGHILAGSDGRLWGIDHGLTFHHTYKLRTVIWDWAGEPLPPGCAERLEAVRAALTSPGGPTYSALGALLTEQEVRAAVHRITHLLATGVLPLPHRYARNVPYPLV